MKRDNTTSGKLKWRLWGLTLFFLLCAYGCENEITSSETITKRGILYQRGSDKPFTGIVTGEARDDYRQITCRFRKRYTKGIQNGVTKYWYPNGNLESIEPYKNGRLHGMVTRYYRNGQMKARIDFVDGFRGGSRGEMYWTPTGKVKPG